MHSSLITSILVATLLALVWPTINYQAAHVDETPKVIETKVPIYPPIAWAAHAAGTVVVEVQIGIDGSVSGAKVTNGHPLLGAVSRNAALSWRFEPASTTNSRRVQLVFDFVPSSDTHCTESYSTVTPYHLKIYPGGEVGKPSDTISNIPANSEEQRCSLHGNLLLRDKVEIVYGLVGFREGYEKARTELFPNANSQAFGGCVVETEVSCDGTRIQISPKYEEVLYCPKCRRAEEKWDKKHLHAPFRS